MRISATIITFNEEKNIREAIASVAWADEVLVVDSESTDDTRKIARDLGARVIVQPWLGFSAQKQFATDQASNDFILSLDADERVTPGLRDEILDLCRVGKLADGYTIPRLSIYMGREIRHGGWYPDRQLRLFQRHRGKWNGRIVHESFVLVRGASKAQLTNDLLHYSVPDPQYHAKLIAERYAPLAASQAMKEGKTSNLLKVVFSGWAAFCRSYFLKLGFLDGEAGYRIATFAAHHSRLKNLILRDLIDQNADSHRDLQL